MYYVDFSHMIMLFRKLCLFKDSSNLLPRVLRLFGQGVGARTDSGDIEKIQIF